MQEESRGDSDGSFEPQAVWCYHFKGFGGNSMERMPGARERASRTLRSIALLFALLIGGLIVGGGYNTEFGCGCKPVTFNPPSMLVN
jgi:hypothetical protein